jgi:hypothetical protein
MGMRWGAYAAVTCLEIFKRGTELIAVLQLGHWVLFILPLYVFLFNLPKMVFFD